MKKILFFTFAVLAVMFAFSQPANNNCNTAQSITVPTPPACPNGNGATTTVAGTNVGATPGNPYIYQTACNPGGPMSTFQNDVWYSFVATGYQAIINIGGGTLNGINVAVWSGNCNNLQGRGCATSTTNNVTLTVEQLVIGQTYYIQVSGNNGNSGTFNLTIDNNIDCQDCLTSATLTANPPPVNGTYQPGQTVTFCFHVNSYNQINTNWLHGVQVTLGSGWNAATLTPTTTPPVCQVPASGGQWLWLPSCTSTATGQTFGQGWYFDTGDIGTNPGNNFGDNCSGQISAANWNFCFSVTTPTVCNSGSNLSITINTSGDGESGSWSSLGCFDDPPVSLNAVGACCPPTFTTTPAGCAGNNGSATATPVNCSGSPYSYSWTGPNGYTNTTANVSGGNCSNTITGLAPGTYTLVMTNSVNCATTATVTVGTSGTNPVATATNTGPYCAGSTIQLNSTGGGTYAWSGPGGFTSTLQNPTIPSSTTANSGVYTVTVTVTGCTATASTTVTVNPLPVPTATNTGPYCPGATIQLNATGGGTYSWSGPGGFTSTLQNPTLPTATTAMSGVYTVTVTLNGCTATATTSVTVNPTPTVTATNTGPYCPGATIQLNSTGGGTYSWSGPNAFTDVNQNPSISGATTAMSGAYTVTVTLNGCTATATTNVVVNPIPVPSATNTGPYCPGATIQLNSTGGGTYSWSGPSYSSTTQNPTIGSATTTMSGAYTVTVTLNGCTATATTTVTVNPTPTITATNTGPYCQTATIQLNATGGGTYSWSGPSSFTSTQQNPSLPGATTSMGGVYTVTVTLNSCTATATTTVTVANLFVPTPSSNSPICSGATLNLSCGNGISWSWTGPNGFTSTLQNPSIAPTTTAATGVYTVSATDVSGCVGTGTVNVVVNPLPTLTTTSSTVCIGASGTLTAAGASTYSWNPATTPATGSSVSATPTVTTTYTVIGTDANNCVNTSTATITVNPLPVITAVSASACANFPATLTASGASTYTWTPTNPQATGASLTVSLTSNTTYTVTGTDVNGCVNSTTATVTINPGIVVDAGPNDTICFGDNILLNATGPANTTYTWNFGGGQTATGASQTLPAALAGVATFTVDAIDNNGCTGSDVVTITVPPQIVLNAGGFPETCFGACNGQVVVLANPTTGPFANYTYLWSNNNQSPSSNNMCAGTWSVTVTDAAGCSDTASAVVTSPPAVIANATGVTPATCNAACDGAVTINANGGAGNFTYTWNPSGSGSNPTNLCAGNYTCTVADANNCSVQVPVVINQPTPITVSITPVATICIGQSANLNSTAGGGNGSYVYTWTGGTTPTNAAGVSASPTVTTVYTVSVTDVNNCPAAVASVTVTVNPPLSVVVSNNVTICGGQTGNMNANASGGNGAYTYTWATGTTPTVGANVSATPSSTTVYTVTVTDGCGTPSATGTVSIIVSPAPTLSITTSAPNGCAPWCVTFTGTSNPASASCSWVFSDNQTSTNNCTPNICFNNPGSYGATFNVTDINGCTNSLTQNNIVNAYPVPVAEFTWSPQPISELSPLVSFYDQSTGGTISGWNWQFGDPLDNSSQIQSPSFTYPGAGTFDVTLVVVNSNGCIDSITHTIIIIPEFSIYVPNAFTPGNDDGSDGVNDNFYPKGVGIDTDNFEMWIYDRWGNNIFYTNDFFKHWDGKVQGGSGTLVQQDVYVWKIKLRTEAGDKKSFVGHVTVIR